MTAAEPEAGSYRDPSGRVFLRDGRVFRTVMPAACEDYEFVCSSGALDRLVADGSVIDAKRVPLSLLGSHVGEARYLLEHPRLPFVSYPYEWPFSALKTAALHHLDVHLEVLQRGVNLSDASAYNIQFRGARPVFIDTLSFRRYRAGEFWIAHRQFCDQFLNPLLLRSACGIPHNAWYRGTLEGIGVDELNRLLPRRRKFSWNVLTHVALQASFQKRATRDRQTRLPKNPSFPLEAFLRMLRGLRKWIAKLNPPGSSNTVWADYATDNSYSEDEAAKKRTFVAEFSDSIKPDLLLDVGCNTGDHVKVALDSGASCAIGCDFDQTALERAFSRARSERMNFTPLFMDLANPSPDQGWAGQERHSLLGRAPFDALFALALIHHLAISRNVPLPHIVDWLVDLAPRGVVEFVPKRDPMVQELLRLRDDIFDTYNEESFSRSLSARARIVKTATVSSSGRRLFWYERD